MKHRIIETVLVFLLLGGVAFGATKYIEGDLSVSGTLTTPTVIGGTTTTSDLNLKTTTGVGTTGADMHFLVGNNGATEAMTILNSGNVGIGTTSPNAATKLDVVGAIRASTGILFGTDTAAANTLDDYEEGTWTPAITFGGAAVDVTYGLSNKGFYTKIGNRVLFNGTLTLTSKGSSSGNALITGLPVTAVEWSAVTIGYLNNTTFANVPLFNIQSSAYIVAVETSDAGVSSVLTDANFANGSQIIFSGVYRE